MRIIAGSLKRRSISIPRGLDIRPTTDRTREALFSLVEARLDLEDAHVLDLFAGSGALGFEAVSRGARTVEFVENDRRAARALRDNAAALGVDDRATVFEADALGFLRRYAGEAWDCIFADPPYHMAEIADLPGLALPHVASGGLFVLEHDRRIRFESDAALITSRSYGRSTVSLFASE